MGLDIRLPIGLMFSIMGALLTAFGLASDAPLYERSLGVNVNAWWGLVLMIFGICMFREGRKTRAAEPPAPESP